MKKKTYSVKRQKELQFLYVRKLHRFDIIGTRYQKLIKLIFIRFLDLVEDFLSFFSFYFDYKYRVPIVDIGTNK